MVPAPITEFLAQRRDVGGDESDVELLRSAPPDIDSAQPDDNMASDANSGTARHGSDLHQVIGEALELFSRHLRA